MDKELMKMLYFFSEDGQLVSAFKREDLLEFYELPEEIQNELLEAWKI